MNKAPEKPAYLIVNTHTGLMDGFYYMDFKSATQQLEYLQEEEPNIASCWILTEVKLFTEQTRITNNVFWARAIATPNKEKTYE
jgi:hypothetical protein